MWRTLASRSWLPLVGSNVSPSFCAYGAGGVRVGAFREVTSLNSPCSTLYKPYLHFYYPVSSALTAKTCSPRYRGGDDGENADGCGCFLHRTRKVGTAVSFLRQARYLLPSFHTNPSPKRRLLRSFANLNTRLYFHRLLCVHRRMVYPR